MARLMPEFSAGRTIQNYTEGHYPSDAAGYANVPPKTAPSVLNCCSGYRTLLKNGTRPLRYNAG